MSPRTPAQNEEIRLASQEKILRAAFELIAQNGYESTSIAMIAKKAGVSKGLLYNYFDKKEDLVRALLEAAMREGDVMLRELMDDDASATLKNIFQWFFREMREQPHHWRLMAELSLKIDNLNIVRKFALGKLNEYVGLMENLLTRLGYENALGEARLIVALFDGIGFEALILKKDYPLDEMEAYLITKYCQEK